MLIAERYNFVESFYNAESVPTDGVPRQKKKVKYGYFHISPI